MDYLHVQGDNPWYNYYLCYRLQELERRVFIDNGNLPASVCEVKHQVEEFKHKLQVWQY